MTRTVDADDVEFGLEIVHFDCAKYLASVARQTMKVVVLGMEGVEVSVAVYDALVGDAYSERRTKVAERACDYGLAILYKSLLHRRIHPDALPYKEINKLKMSGWSYKDVMTGPVYSVVRDFMRIVGVAVVNDVDNFIVK